MSFVWMRRLCSGICPLRSKLFGWLPQGRHGQNGSAIARRRDTALRHEVFATRCEPRSQLWQLLPYADLDLSRYAAIGIGECAKTWHGARGQYSDIQTGDSWDRLIGSITSWADRRLGHSST